MKNNQRQYNLDLLKAFVISFMPLCHIVQMFGMYRPDCANEVLYTFATRILGGYLVAAHGFMFAMGVGMAYSGKNSPGEQIHRGINLFLLAYVLNFFRYGMYFLSEGLITGSFSIRAVGALFGGDILQFAGLAFVATGIFQKLKLKETEILSIALILSLIGTMAAGVDTQNFVLNLLIGLFVFTPDHASTFCFCNWYLYVAAGIIFGKILKAMPDKDTFYKKLLIVSGVISAAYIALSCKFGMMFLCKTRGFYDASPLEAFGLLSIDFFFLSAFYFLLKKVDASKFRHAIEMSKNINTIYCIHWCILGPLEFFLCYLLKLEIVSNYVVMYTFGIVLVVVSFLLARHYKSWKARFMERYS